MTLKAARKASGKTQAQVAKEVGITVRGYQEIEAKHKYRAVERAIKIAKVLDRPVEELFGEDPPSSGIELHRKV